MSGSEIPLPIRGKTYSLYGGTRSSGGYYRDVRALTDACLAECAGAAILLGTLQNAARSRARARNSTLYAVLRPVLSRYITELEEHLRALPLRGRMERVLAMNEAQYMLAMLEIELVNRVHRDRFLAASRRIALLPHCLRDLHPQCQAAVAGVDYVCRRCTDDCFIHRASNVLAHNRVKAYIWMNANLRKLIRHHADQNGTLGVLGIACIPELVHGMRRCISFGIPVIGIPLDANRCSRWMGETHPNTVNLEELERLIAPN